MTTSAGPGSRNPDGRDVDDGDVGRGDVGRDDVGRDDVDRDDVDRDDVDRDDVDRRERPNRDRDAAGRARNARPRDGLGRPLPPGAPGVPTTPDDLSLNPAESLAEAQRLLDAGMPFHAHEVLEASWKAAPDGERELWRGLAQLAVGLTHVRRGNDVGAPRLLRRAADRIEDYAAGPPHRIAVAELAAWARDLAGQVERTGAAKLPPASSVPRLTT